MANLKMGTLLGGNMIWHTGNMPLDTSDDVLIFKTFKVYHEGHKPTPAEVGAVNKAGDTMTGELNATSDIRIKQRSESGAGHLWFDKFAGTKDYGGVIYLDANTNNLMLRRHTGSTINSELSIGNNEIRSKTQIYQENGTANDPKALTRKDYVDSRDNLKVNKAGDTMTGKLKVPGTDALGALSLGDASYVGNNASKLTFYISTDKNETKNGWAFRTLTGGAGQSSVVQIGVNGDIDTTGKVLFGSQGQLVSDSDEVYMHNSKVTSSGYRSFSLRDNGSPEFYSVTNGYKKIYHEGHKPSSSEITDLESKTAVSFKKAYHFNTGSTASGWTKIAHLDAGSTGLRIQANISSHCSTFNNFKMDMTVNGRPACFLGTFSQRLGSNPFGIVIYEIPNGSYPDYEVYAYIAGYTQGLIELSTLGIESYVDYPETLTYSSTKPVLPSGGSQRMDTTALGSGLYTFAGNGYTSQQVYHQGRKPSPDEIGAVAKTGDVMTGRLQMGNGPGDTASYYYVNTKGLENLSDLDTKGKGNIGQLRFRTGNNGMAMGLVGEFNERQGYIQVGHGDDSYSTTDGTLYLQPQGGYTSLGGVATMASGMKATWDKNYVCSATKITPLVYHDGSELGVARRGYLKVTAVIRGTGTNTGASAVFFNGSGSGWTVRYLGAGGIGSNHIEFIVGSNGKPSVKTAHPNDYTVTVVHEYTRMGSEGKCHPNAAGLEYRLSSPTVTGAIQLDGNKIYTSGDKPTPAEVGAVNKTGDTMTGDLIIGSGVDTAGNLQIKGTGVDNGISIVSTGGISTRLFKEADNTFKITTSSGVGMSLDTTGNLETDGTIKGTAVGIAGEIGFGNMGHGAVQYPAETIQLGGSRNLRINFGANERMLLTNAGGLTVDAQMQATYTGSLALSEQKNTKAAFYTEKITGGSSEFHTFIKQKLTKTGSNADTWNYSMGQLISSSKHAGFWIQGQKHSDSSVKQWAFKETGNFDVAHGTINIKGKEVYHEGHKPTAAELNVLSKTPVGIANEVYAPMTSKDDWQESPIILRERGAVEAGQSNPKYSPNLCFHWAGKVAKSLYMPVDGKIYWGEYDGSGTPSGHKIYHAGDKPTTKEIGAASTTVAGLTGASQWNHMCTVEMPQGASTVVIEIESGNGFNVGTASQLGTQKIHIRSGNNSPKGINIVSYRDGQLSRMISDMGWKNTSGNTYEIYARAETYPAAGLIWSYKASSNASVTWRGNGVGTTQPAGITKWLKDIINYNTEYKPTATDVNAVAKTGDTMTGALTLPSAVFSSLSVSRSGNSSRQSLNVKSSSVLTGISTTYTDSSGSQITAFNALTNASGVVDFSICGHEVYHEGHKPTLAEINAQKKITYGTGNPSGGSTGDVYIQYK